MLNVLQFREYVVRPTLIHLALFSPAAENLLVGTALKESALFHLDQLTPGPGPAFGIYQMERATHDDIWDRYLSSFPPLAAKVASTAAPWPERVYQLHTNLAYATAMARIHYYRVRESLPAADDVLALGRYWKLHYNTPRGKGTVEEFVKAYGRAA